MFYIVKCVEKDLFYHPLKIHYVFFSKHLSVNKKKRKRWKLKFNNSWRKWKWKFKYIHIQIHIINCPLPWNKMLWKIRFKMRNPIIVCYMKWDTKQQERTRRKSKSFLLQNAKKQMKWIRSVVDDDDTAKTVQGSKRKSNSHYIYLCICSLNIYYQHHCSTLLS